MKRWKVITLATFLCLNLLLCSFTFVAIYRKPENTSRKDHGHGQDDPGVKLKSTAAKLTVPRVRLAEVDQQPRRLRGYTTTRLVPANPSTDREEQTIELLRRPYFARRSEKLEVEALLLNFTLTPESDHCSDRFDARLLVAVCSSLDHFERREAIRATWGNATLLAALRIAIVFVIGLPQPNSEHLQTFVTQEHLAHGDIVQLNHVDHYRNLSLKSLGMLHWSANRCTRAAGARHLLKTDDDVFVNAPYLMRYLEGNGYYSSSAAGRRNFILGSIIQAAQPVRNRMSKWFTPESVFRGDVYPAYTSGTAYLISGDAVLGLFAEGMNQPIFWLEDVFLTGIVAKKLDVEMIHDARFHYRKTRRKGNVCWYKTVFTEHDVSPANLLRIWEFAGFDDEANDFLWTNYCRNATENRDASNLPNYVIDELKTSL